MKHHLRSVPKPGGRPPAGPVSARQPRQRAVVGRKSKAEPLAASGLPPGQGLNEALKLQRQLRRLAHRVLAAQEDERLEISRELRDEIAQMLLGINVRLLLLNRAARSKAKGIKNQIASAQRLVLESATLVRGLARELDHHQPTPSELRVLAI